MHYMMNYVCMIPRCFAVVMWPPICYGAQLFDGNVSATRHFNVGNFGVGYLVMDFSCLKFKRNNVVSIKLINKNHRMRFSRSMRKKWQSLQSEGIGPNITCKREGIIYMRIRRFIKVGQTGDKKLQALWSNFPSKWCSLNNSFVASFHAKMNNVFKWVDFLFHDAGHTWAGLFCH